MSLELNKNTFRRLVQLYLALLLGSLFLALLGGADTAWNAWAAGGSIPESRTRASTPVMIVLLSIFVLHIASAVGLLRFKRWARLGFWATILMLAAVVSAVTIEASSSARRDPWFDELISSLAGAILLLCYASGLGSEWFRATTGAQKVN